MVRELGWSASPLGVDGRPTMAALARWWGCCAPNRLADRAGRYRRIASALALLSLPLVGMAVTLVVDDPSSIGYPSAHLVAAVGCGWLAYDLMHRASALNRNERPLVSAVALLAGIGLLIGLSPVEPAAGFGPPILLSAGLLALALGYVMLMAGERRRDQLLFAIGRCIIVAGAILVGVMESGQTILAYPDAPRDAIGPGIVAVVLLTMAWCEGRVLLRGAALVRALARR